MIDIAENVARVRARVARAAERAGRPAEAVCLIAATKTQSPEFVTIAVQAGVTDVGENYVQEAATKVSAVALPVRWHLIGHLQRNKASRAAELFETIQSLDSIALADALDRKAAHLDRRIHVLIEVNTGGEASKHGLRPDDVAALVSAVAIRRHLHLDGLMTIPPPVATADDARPYFTRLRELREHLQHTTGSPLAELSMGMTDDFEVAIEEGATMVRVGRAIFGARPR